MTAVIYARYSSSSQREASIEEWQIDYKNIKKPPGILPGGSEDWISHFLLNSWMSNRSAMIVWSAPTVIEMSSYVVTNIALPGGLI